MPFGDTAEWHLLCGDLLIVRVYVKTAYRGLFEFLKISPSLHWELGLEDELPHYTTLQKLSTRSQMISLLQPPSGFRPRERLMSCAMTLPEDPRVGNQAKLLAWRH